MGGPTSAPISSALASAGIVERRLLNYPSRFSLSKNHPTSRRLHSRDSPLTGQVRPGQSPAKTSMHIESVYHGNMDERRNVRHVPPRQYNAPEKTVELIDRVSKKGDRSRFINEAVKRYVREVGRAKIRKELKAAYLEGAERD